jgi:hypothetical protein
MKTMKLKDRKYHAVIRTSTISTDGTRMFHENGRSIRMRKVGPKMLWDVQTADYSLGSARVDNFIVTQIATRRSYSEKDGRELVNGVFRIVEVDDKF